MRDFQRDLRIADFVREESARIMQRMVRDPRLRSVGINDVRVSKDLSYADIYVTSLEPLDPDARTELVEVLNRASGFFRSELARRHTMRTTPKPRFHYDVSVERGPRLERLISQALAADRSAQSHG